MTRIYNCKLLVLAILLSGISGSFCLVCDEFQCPEHDECIEYELKCNDENDGCSNGTEEIFCDGFLKYFDWIEEEQIHESSIAERIPTDDEEGCAYACLNQTDFQCVAFQFGLHDGNGSCGLAPLNYNVTQNGLSGFFRIEKMPLPGSVVTGLRRRIATPKWLPAYTDTDSFNDTGNVTMHWILEPEDEHITNIVIIFELIDMSDELNTTNIVRFKSGRNESSPIVAEYSLNKLPDAVQLNGSIFRLEFISIDIYEFGFLGEYEADTDINTTPMETDMTSVTTTTRMTDAITEMTSTTENVTKMTSKTDTITDVTSKTTFMTDVTSKKTPITEMTSKVDHLTTTTLEPITDGEITSIETGVTTIEIQTTQAVTNDITTKMIIPTELFTTKRAPTEPIEPPPYAGPLPPAEYPAVPDAEKKISIIIKVLNAPDDCVPESIDSCGNFTETFTIEISAAYKAIKGFSNVEVTQLSQPLTKDNTLDKTLYVEHEAIYVWNDMDAGSRGLTANEVYDLTVAEGISNGNIGNLILTTCEECQPPQETTAICSNNAEIACDSTLYLDAACIDGLPVCQSMCLNTVDPYCTSHIGICTQESSLVAPQCSCLQASDIFYFGDQCQWSFDKLWLYVSVGLTGFLIIVLVTVLCVCLAAAKKQNRELVVGGGKYTSESGEEVLGIHSYGITNEVYDPSNPDGEMYLTKHDSFFDVIEPLDSPLDDTFPQNPTYSFGVTPVGSTTTSRVNSIEERRDDPAFWGNVCDDFNRSYQAEMQPISSPQTHA